MSSFRIQTQAGGTLMPPSDASQKSSDDAHPLVSISDADGGVEESDLPRGGMEGPDSPPGGAEDTDSPSTVGLRAREGRSTTTTDSQEGEQAKQFSTAPRAGGGRLPHERVRIRGVHFYHTPRPIRTEDTLGAVACVHSAEDAMTAGVDAPTVGEPTVGAPSVALAQGSVCGPAPRSARQLANEVPGAEEPAPRPMAQRSLSQGGDQRERDPLRLSRFLAFPRQVTPHGAEVHLFDGLMSQNIHDIRLLRTGYYGIRLHNQNESAWDGLYLGIGRMKAVAEFTVTPPPVELKNGASTRADGVIYQHHESTSTLDLSSDTNGLKRTIDSLSDDDRHPTSVGHGQGHNVESSSAPTGDSPPKDKIVPFARDRIASSETQEAPEAELDGIGAPGSAFAVRTPPPEATDGARSEDDDDDKARSDSPAASDSRRRQSFEAPSQRQNSSESVQVLTSKGSLVCKAQQDKHVYFYVEEPFSLLKLHVYASLTLGMRLRCSYDLLFCGTPRVIPSNPLVPFLRNASILCLDGGGILGISSLKILERLELEIQKELNDPSVRLTDCFDMVAGTSTGGVLTLGLMTGLSIKEMISMWASMSGRIFEGNRTLFSGIFFEGYDVNRLRNALMQSLGHRFMNTYSRPYCFVTSTDVKHNPYELFLIRNYTHSHLAKQEFRGGSSMPVWSAAWATAAAPTYLKGPNPEELEKMGLLIHPEVQLCDGAMKANNPTMVALEEAARLAGKRLQQFIESDLDVLLSIGTGQPTLKQTIAQTGIVSTFQIIMNSAHLLTSATSVHRDVVHWLGDYEDRYFRFNVPGIGDIPLDAVEKSAYDLIIKATNDYLTDEKYFDIRRLCRKLAAHRVRH